MQEIISVAKIPILLPAPENYIWHLKRRLLDEYPLWSRLASTNREIDLQLGNSRDSCATHLTSQETLGYGKNEIQLMLDRDWIKSKFNEHGETIDFIDPSVSLAGVKNVSIYGAGLCRLAETLGRIDSIQEISCSDLSWQLIYNASHLLSGKHHLFPEKLNDSRILHIVDKTGKSLEKKRLSFDLIEPLPKGRLSKIKLSVGNILSIDPSLKNELVIVPFVFDTQRGIGFETLAIRLCQQISIGCSVLILMSLDGRPPDSLIAILNTLGFEISIIRIRPLPYSFTRIGDGLRRQRWRTILVKATKTKAQQLKKINLRLQIDLRNLSRKKNQVSITRNGETHTLDSLSSSYVAAAIQASNCLELERRLEKQKIVTLEHALAYLTTNRLIYLGINDS